MRSELAAFFGPQEERLTLAGEDVVVRTLPEDAEVEAFKDPTDILWKFMVRCTFYVKDGAPCFTDADIEHLKAAPRVKMLRLVQAVENVNGFELYADVKNSAAAPISG